MMIDHYMAEQMEAAAINSTTIQCNEVKTINGYFIKPNACPMLMEATKFRKEEDYRYANAYAQGWNDAMKSIFEIEDLYD